jgi:hypothetical protein
MIAANDGRHAVILYQWRVDLAKLLQMRVSNLANTTAFPM